MVKAVKWFWAMKKAAKPLLYSTFSTTNKNSAKCFEISYHTTPHKWVDGDIYFCEENINKIRAAIKNNIEKDSNYTERIANNLYKMRDKVLETSIYLINQDLKSLSNKNLLESFEKSFEQIGLMECFMSYRGTIQLAEILEEKVKQILAKKLNKLNKLELLEEFFLILSKPSEESYMIRYKNDLLKAKISMNQSNNTKIINNLLMNYSWIGCSMFSGAPLTKEKIIQGLDQLKDPQTELRKYEKDKDLHLKKFKKIVKDLNFNQDEKKLIHNLQNWFHLRTYARDIINNVITNNMPLLFEIAERASISKQNIPYLIKDEILNIFSLPRKELLSNIVKRKKKWAALVINDKVTFFAENISQLKEKEKIEPTNVIKGKIAAKGYVKAPVILMNDASELDKIKPNHILVTPMTTTDYTPILNKLAGIITDEGGLTCHAAIVSRELNIPCIIGTQVATKLLKDNQLVELNANKGIVKILKS
tara:strand:+ start:2171 stop:3601 length:1431 start_codon:yes stop_codon:yes gene_type:complete